MSKALGKVKEVDIVVVEQVEEEVEPELKGLFEKIKKLLPWVDYYETVEGYEERVETVVVKKQPLQNWKRLTEVMENIFDSLPKILDEMDVPEHKQEQFLNSLSIADLIGLVPRYFDILFDEIVRLIAIGTELDKEFIDENVGAYEAMQLFEAIIEVNDLIEAVDTGNAISNLFKESLK